MNTRTIALIGDEAYEKLKGSTVAVFGIGGVGSYAAEALARSGVGTLYLYDNDTVSVSNINRQLVALSSTVGRYKTEIAHERIKAINPDVTVIECREFVTRDSDIPFDKFDAVIDAVDNVTAKLFIAENCADKPFISVMGTGNKLCPERIRISDLFDTSECPLCRVMRTECRKKNIDGFDVVWSDEHPKKSPLTENGKTVPASMVFVPAAAGMTAASYIIRKLINFNK